MPGYENFPLSLFAVPRLPPKEMPPRKDTTFDAGRIGRGAGPIRQGQHQRSVPASAVSFLWSAETTSNMVPCSCKTGPASNSTESRHCLPRSGERQITVRMTFTWAPGRTA